MTVIFGTFGMIPTNNHHVWRCVP